MTRVLSVASECVPLVKTGGLADVAGALPAAVAAHGVDMATLIPGYPAVIAHPSLSLTATADLGPMFGGPARVMSGQLGERMVHVLDAPHLYDRPGNIYLGADGKDWPDNPQRFAALCQTAALIADQGLAGWRPDALHLHDWQAGLTPVYLAQRGATARTGTLITVHNIAFQGLAPASMLGSLDLPRSGFQPEGFEYFGQISALKAGLIWSDRISTVSPTYARELMSPQFGMGLDGVLRNRRADLVGILNGIDEDLWTPRYKTPRGKARYTAALRAETGLPDTDGPLCVVVSRLTEQKGLDMLLDALPVLLEGGGQLALLGSGDARLEAAFRDAAQRHPGVWVRIGYDEGLARRLIEGGDAILVPSRFEPCGLTQMYGLRFGTLPVVALTGGLADTVIPASPAARAKGVATGFQFFPVDQPSLEAELLRLVRLFGDRDAWARMQRNAMAQDVGWDASAAHYAQLYMDIAKTS